MQLNDDHFNLMLRYFDDELSDEEAVAFIKLLEANPGLQQAFDQQVLMQQFSEEDEQMLASPGLESADTFIKNIEGLSVQEPPSTARVVGFSKTRIALLAAACIAALLVAAYLLMPDKSNPAKPIVVVPAKPSTPTTPTIDTSTNRNQVAAISEDYYTTLAANALQVPSELAGYSMSYEEGKFEKVANASNSILDTKGIGPDRSVLDYFNFYKAIANLQIGKLSAAITLLKDVSKTAATDTRLHQQVKWYLLMAYLKAGDKDNALKASAAILKDHKNPYHRQAAEITLRLQR